jgi:hypothetical protein
LFNIFNLGVEKASIKKCINIRTPTRSPRREAIRRQPCFLERAAYRGVPI